MMLYSLKIETIYRKLEIMKKTTFDIQQHITDQFIARLESVENNSRQGYRFNEN